MAGTRRQPVKRMIILCVAGVILAAGIAAVVWQAGWFRQADSKLTAGQPGSAADSSGQYRQSGDAVASLQQNLLKLLEKENGSLASWFRLSGKYGQPEAVLSMEYLGPDQLRYGQYLLEQGDRKAFQTWWLSFRTVFRSDAGLIRANAADADTQIAAADNFWRTNIAAARLLIQSCSAWPDRQRRADLNQLSAKLLDLADTALVADYAAAVPTPGPNLDPAATPTPKPEITAAAVAVPTLAVLRLASVDLLAMQQLAQLDSRWQELFSRCLPLVENGYLGDELPLYALAYDEAQGGYVTYSGTTPSIDTEEALLTMLHLCEAGQDIGHGLSWLRDQMYNEHALYNSYHVTQSQATSSQECLAGYAIVARIARIKGDQDLYQAAVSRLLWHQATSQSSKALGSIFRVEEASGLYLVTAEDNTWALLALH